MYVEALDRVASSFSNPPPEPWEYNEQKSEDDPPAAKLIDTFGSWESAVSEALDEIAKTGFVESGLSHPPTQFSRAEYVSAVQDYYETHGEPPCSNDMFESDILISSHSYRELFGSWADVVRAAGYVPSREYSNDELLLVIRKVSRQVDGTLSVSAFDETKAPHHPSPGPYSDRFGGWRNAKEQFVTGDYPTEFDCITHIQRVADSLGRPPTQGQYQAHTASDISTAIILDYFDTWDAALRQAGCDPARTKRQNQCVTTFYEQSLWAVIREAFTKEPISCPFCDGEYVSSGDATNHLQRSHSQVYQIALLDELRFLRAKLGTTPSLQLLQDHSVFQRTAYEDNYGSWNDAVEQAGFQSFERPDISKECLIKDIQRVSTEHLDGERPHVSDMDEFGKYHPETYRRYFESQFWKALDSAGFEPNVMSNISENILLDEIRRVAAIIDNPPPTLDEIEEHGRCAASNYFTTGDGADYFESWNDALTKAGLDPNIRHDRTDEEIIDDFTEVIDQLGRVPTQDEFRSHISYTPKTVYRRFGGWNALVREAGYEPPHRKDIPYDDLLSEIHDLYDTYGRAPTCTEMRNEGAYSITAYRRAFGTWTSAVEHAGYTPMESPKGEYHPDWKPDVDTDYYGPNWREQRAKCIGRDGRQCRVCGKTQHEIGREPSVHHIRPRSEFDKDEYVPMNSLENLIALCPSCHSKFEGRWPNKSPREFEEHAKAALDSSFPDDSKNVDKQSDSITLPSR